MAKTLLVGKEKVITSLQKAIQLAHNGDTILLEKGYYRESNIIIDKSIYLIGIDGPVLDGEKKNQILTATGQNILIKGIHFRNAGYSSVNDLSAISIIDASYVILENNTIEDAFFAIHIANA